LIKGLSRSRTVEQGVVSNEMGDAATFQNTQIRSTGTSLDAQPVACQKYASSLKGSCHFVNVTEDPQRIAKPHSGGNMISSKRSALILAIPIILVFSSLLVAQAVQKPVYAGYRGVMVGMPMADARTKLGTAKDKSDTEDYYVYSDNESAQVLYGADKTVRVISINYIGKNAPSPIDILGTAVESKPDGSMNKMVRYPKSGFWISYLKTGGDDPMVIVTVQKMAVEP